jgi:hypothetical protein
MYACVLVNIGVCGAGDNQIQQRHYYSAKARTFPAAQSAQWRLQRRAHRACAQSTVHSRSHPLHAGADAQGDPAAKHRAALGRALSPLDGSFW